mmetsp:Transcript_60081/g.159808  ORF Transcript_60081/g.159808 Transcript_60081/m.159808 type:complete len:181 (-) Transcript_60081:118-660(-)
MSHLWEEYLSLLQRRPLPTKCVSSSFLLVSSQICSQLLLHSKVSNVNKLRDWSLWGFVLATYSHYWNNFLALHGPSSLFLKVPLDQIFNRGPNTFAFSLYSKVMEGSSIKDSWDYTVKTNGALQVASLKLWPLATLINLKFVPLHLRVLFMNFVIFFWGIYLATKMKKQQEAEKKALESK